LNVKEWRGFGRRVAEGRPSPALDWLEKPYHHHDYWMLFLNADPKYARRSDLRFQAIVHHLGVG
jgi:hypothetical protein